jgi:hypothetical protein
MTRLELLIKIKEVRELLEGAVNIDHKSRTDDLFRCLLQLYHSLYLLNLNNETETKKAKGA